MSEAVKAAIAELEQEYVRIGEAIEALRKFAGMTPLGVRPANGTPAAGIPCKKCDFVAKNELGIKLHVQRKH